MSIDKRIVEMKFDNQQFEKGIAQSNKSLEQLKNNLNMDGATRGLSELDRAARSFSLAGIANGVDAIASKFNAMTIVGITALQNITNSAINAGMRIASALTIDPISAGFSEYEQKMGSIQTILTNTQSRQKDVNKDALKAINDQADAALSKVKSSGTASVASTKNVYDEKIKIYQKNAKEEIKILNDKFDDELDAIEKITKEETKAFKKAHEEKLKMYDAEYMSKLKVLDEDRYNEIKDIDAQIDAINAKTQAEEKALEEKRQKEKLREMERRIDEAKTAEDRKAARKALAEYEEELDRKAIMSDRQLQIEALKNKKETINEQYDLMEENLEKEYDAKVNAEKELYEVEFDNLKEQQDERLKVQKRVHEDEKEKIQERHNMELESLRELQAAAVPKGGGGGNKSAQIAAIEAEREAQIRALMEAERGMTEGSTLEDVNKALNELNEYADKTIYNFAEMTRNIGTFTAAGIDLDTSVASIKGIANLAAGSGSTAQQASTAMYQLSQAIAAGSVKLQDWNSVVNAGMGGRLFQDALKETAKDMGVFVNEAVPFRESLESGWVSAEVLTATLSKFAEDEALLQAATQVRTFTQLMDTMKESVQSGWAMSWEYILGDKDEATALFTSISNGFEAIAGSSADARNEMLKFWNDNGGRDAIIDALANSFNALGAILSPIGKAFREVFPAMTGKQLTDISNKIKDLTENFKIGEETADKIGRTFKGLFSILDIGRQAISAVASGIGYLVSVFLPAGDGILSITATIGDFITGLNESLRSTDAFKGVIVSIGTVVSNVAEIIYTSFMSIIDSFARFIGIDLGSVSAFSSEVERSFQPFTKLGDIVSNSLGKIADGMTTLSPIFVGFASIMGKAFSKIGDVISNLIQNADFKSMMDLVNGGIFAAILLGIKKFIDGLSEITDGASGMLDGITGILDGVKDSLEAYQSNLKAGTLIKIASAIAILSAALIGLSMIDSDKLTTALTAMSVMFVELFASMAVFEKIMSGSGFTAMGKITMSMIALSTAILILSLAVKKLAELDWDGLTKGLAGVAALSAILIASAKSLSTAGGQVIKGSVGFVIFAAAINVLTKAVVELGALDIGSLTKGLVGVGVLMTELALFMNATDIGKMGVTKSIGILLLASAMNVMASAVGKMGELDVASITKGLVAMGAVFTQVSLFMNLTGGATKVISTAVGMTILGSAMLIFANAVRDMGSIPIEDIGKGLIGMGGALAVIAGGLAILPKNMIAQGAGLVVVASSLTILSDALTSMGANSWEEIAKSLVTLAGSLTIIAVAMQAMTTALPGASAMLVISAALSIFAPALAKLGEMSIGEIGKSLLYLVGIFTVLGGAATILAPLTPALLALSAAIALLGAGSLAAGAGILAFSTGLAALAVSGTAGAAALVAVVTSLVGLIPYIATTLAEGIVEFIRIIGEGAVTIAKAVEQVAIAILDVIIKVTPKLVEAISVILTAILDLIIEHVPKIVDAGIQLILGFLKGVAANIEEVVKTAIDVVVNFINGVTSKIPDVIQAGVDLIVGFINGLADAIRNNTPLVMEAIHNLFSALIDAAMKIIFGSITGFIDLGTQLIKGLINGVSSSVSGFVKAVGEIISAGLKTFTNSIKDFKDMGKNLIKGFIGGITSSVKDVAKAAADLAKDALDSAKDVLGIHSPSRAFAEIGKFADEGLVQGLLGYAGKVVKASANVGEKATDALKAGLANMSDLADGDVNLSPSIRPVLDMSDVTSGLGGLDRMIGDKSVSAAASISGTLKGQNGRDEQTALLRRIAELLDVNDPDDPKPQGAPIIFNIRSDNGNPLEISRQIQRDITGYNRALGIGG